MNFKNKDIKTLQADPRGPACSALFTNGKNILSSISSDLEFDTPLLPLL